MDVINNFFFKSVFIVRAKSERNHVLSNQARELDMRMSKNFISI